MIKPFSTGDAEALLGIYQRAIHISAAPFYSQAQLLAWAPPDIDLDRWRVRIEGLKPKVVWERGRAIAYADLQPGGYIDHFFVDPDAGGRGVGRLLLTALLREAQGAGRHLVHADVSLSAEGFFSKHGFSVTSRSSNPIRGIEVPNAWMSLDLKSWREQS